MGWPLTVAYSDGSDKTGKMALAIGRGFDTTDNSEVKAVQAGKVAYAGYLLGYGLVVVIAHNDGHATFVTNVTVETGQTVLRQVIAIAGNTMMPIWLYLDHSKWKASQPKLMVKLRK